MICPQCKSHSPEGSNYCFGCGARLASPLNAPPDEFAFDAGTAADGRSDDPLADVPDMHWFLVLVYDLITLGLYGPIWFLRRLGAFERLRGERRLNPGLLTASLIFTAASIVLSFATTLAGDGAFAARVGNTTLGALMDNLAAFLDLLALLLLIHQSLRLRRMLKDHVLEATGREPRITALWSVLFQQIHLQHVINGLKECGRR